MKRFFPMLAVALSLLCAACAPDNAEEPAAGQAAGPLTVYTVNYPLFYFAERIGGEAVEVVFPAPSDADPAYWKPSDEIVGAYQAADLILLNGAEFAKWVATASLPESKLINTSAAASAQYIEIQDAMVHSHGPEGKHAHSGYDFNTWLDPAIAMRQAEAIAAAFAERLPGQKDPFFARAQELSADLNRIDEALKALAESHPDVPLIASHPVYNYLSRRYAWNLKSLHWEPNEMAEDDEWSSLEELVKTHPARFILWEGDPDEAIAARLEGLGLDSVVFYPLGNRPADGDYLSGMEANIARLGQALSAP